MFIIVGENTVIDQTDKLTTGQESNGSRLETQIRKCKISYNGLICCICDIYIWWIVYHWKDVTHLLANGFFVPCGLPATDTSILTLVARRFTNRNAYVKRLDICEALRQVSIIASDKTGTLTRNEMTVTGLWNFDGFINGKYLEEINKYRHKS
uniref:P-type ATPase n=3 Tax=Meloidogyne TaxID=189290 RepID=A0A914M7R2_MELIC